MTEQTETERNEAIKVTFESVLKLAEDNLAFWTSGNYSDHEEEFIREQTECWKIVVTALKQQSEAERKIEKAREYCNRADNCDCFDIDGQDVCEKILEILEGKADVQYISGKHFL